MSRFNVKVEHKPSISSVQCLSHPAMQSILTGSGITWKRMKLDDYYFFAPMWDDWRKIIEHLLPRIPKYYTDKFDCDNMADWFKVHVAEEFGQNTCARVDGLADVGRGYKEPHAWCVFYDASSRLLFQLEPQDGVIMDLDDPLYTPSEIVIG